MPEKSTCPCWAPKLPQEFKALMFGPGLAGKSTIVKAAAFAFSGKPFNDFIVSISPGVIKLMRRNIAEAATVLCAQAKKLYPQEYDEQKEKLGLELITGKSAVKQDFNSLQAKVILNLWNSRLGQMVWSRRNEFYIHDNAAQYIPRCNTIIETSFIPTQNDYLSTREETKLLKTTTTDLPDLGDKQKRVLTIMDCGGQPNHQREYQSQIEYKKFLNSAGLLFVVIPFGDLQNEATTQCITKGLIILQSFLSAAGSGNGGSSTFEFETKVAVVFLNKKDKLYSAVEQVGSAAPLLEAWYRAAQRNLSMLDEHWIIDAIDAVKRNVQTAEEAEQYFIDIVNNLIELHVTDAKNDTAFQVSVTTATEVTKSDVLKQIITRSAQLALATIFVDLGIMGEQGEEDIQGKIIDHLGDAGLDSRSINIENLREKFKLVEKDIQTIFDRGMTKMDRQHLVPVLRDIKTSLQPGFCLDAQGDESLLAKLFGKNATSLNFQVFYQEYLGCVSDKNRRIKLDARGLRLEKLSTRRAMLEPRLREVFNRYDIEKRNVCCPLCFCCPEENKGLSGEQLQRALTELGRKLDSARVVNWLAAINFSSRRLTFEEFLNEYTCFFHERSDSSIGTVVNPISMERSEATPSKRRSSNFSVDSQYAQHDAF